MESRRFFRGEYETFLAQFVAKIETLVPPDKNNYVQFGQLIQKVMSAPCTLIKDKCEKHLSRLLKMAIQLHPEVEKIDIRIINHIETCGSDILWRITSVPVLVRALLNSQFNLVILHDICYVMKTATPLFDFLRACDNIQKMDIMAKVANWDVYSLLELTSSIRMPLLLAPLDYGEGKTYIPPHNLKFQKLLPRQLWEKVRAMIRLGVLKDASDDPKPKQKTPTEMIPKKWQKTKNENIKKYEILIFEEKITA